MSARYCESGPVAESARAASARACSPSSAPGAVGPGCGAPAAMLAGCPATSTDSSMVAAVTPAGSKKFLPVDAGLVVALDVQAVDLRDELGRDGVERRRVPRHDVGDRHEERRRLA